MEANRNIEELREMAPVVAEASGQNLYSVPAGYFDSLAESILNQVKLAEIKYSNSYFVPDGYFDLLADSVINHMRLEEVKHSNPYSIPAGYFDSLADSVINHIRLEEIKHSNPYSVSDGYFDSLPETILNIIRISEIKHSNLYSVPPGYFENFADSVLNQIKSPANAIREELSEVAPLLNTIDKSNIFSVPIGYFENLSAVSANPEPKVISTSKVISIGSRVRKWTTYAAAACVLFIIAATTYLYVNVHGKIFEEQLPIEQRISQLDETEITNYLKDNDGIITGDVISTSTEQDPEIQHLLKNASDEDIQNYLDEYSDPDESSDNGI